LSGAGITALASATFLAHDEDTQPNQDPPLHSVVGSGPEMDQLGAEIDPNSVQKKESGWLLAESKDRTPLAPSWI